MCIVDTRFSWMVYQRLIDDTLVNKNSTGKRDQLELVYGLQWGKDSHVRMRLLGIHVWVKSHIVWCTEKVLKMNLKKNSINIIIIIRVKCKTNPLSFFRFHFSSLTLLLFILFVFRPLKNTTILTYIISQVINLVKFTNLG